MRKFELIITCPDGLDKALMTELSSFGLEPGAVRTGRVAVMLNLAQLYHVCLYSRVASRVFLPLGNYAWQSSVDASNISSNALAQSLYGFARTIAWEKIFGLDDTFAIRLNMDKKIALHQQFAMLKVKDAIADHFNERFGARPNVDSRRPNVSIAVHVSAAQAEFFLDLSGGSLHRRGYRLANTHAPLKENLAAALLYECQWHLGAFDTLIDPMCGSGTFIIEALLMTLDYPVGLEKAHQHFGFHHWQHHDETLWQQTVQQAQEAFHAKLNSAIIQKNLPRIIASDASLSATVATQKNILSSALAPLAQVITITCQPVSALPARLQALPVDSRSLLITNPPYGERLGDDALIAPLYQGLGLMLQEYLLGSGYIGILASDIEAADTLLLNSPATLRCHNGALTVYFRHGALLKKSQSGLIADFKKKTFDLTGQDEFLAGAADFINRLQKNLSHLKKRAQQADISNLRVYDADLPDFNVAIDVYGHYVHIQEYSPPKSIDPEVAKARFSLILKAVAQIFAVNREAIFIKTRSKQAGKQQYSKTSNHGKRYIVKENTGYFYVNFSDYLDTGLFLDHRPMRHLLASESVGKKVLNLFAYTCSASVLMALAGAKTVTSVDLSDNYLLWGKQNFALNGLYLDGENSSYEFIAADAFAWLKTHTQQYDLIFIDPPTFSNSKKFHGTFDVQRDHAALINRAMNRLAAGGVLYFSNNFSRFILDDSIKRRYQIEVISSKTTGFDFKKGLHSSFKITHKAQAMDSQKLADPKAGQTNPLATRLLDNQPKSDKRQKTKMPTSNLHPPALVKAKVSKKSLDTKAKSSSQPKFGYHFASKAQHKLTAGPKRTAQNRLAQNHPTKNQPSKNPPPQKSVNGFSQSKDGRWCKARPPQDRDSDVAPTKRYYINPKHQKDEQAQ